MLTTRKRSDRRRTRMPRRARAATDRRKTASAGPAVARGRFGTLFVQSTRTDMRWSFRIAVRTAAIKAASVVGSVVVGPDVDGAVDVELAWFDPPEQPATE